VLATWSRWPHTTRPLPAQAASRPCRSGPSRWPPLVVGESSSTGAPKHVNAGTTIPFLGASIPVHHHPTRCNFLVKSPAPLRSTMFHPALRFDPDLPLLVLHPAHPRRPARSQRCLVIATILWGFLNPRQPALALRPAGMDHLHPPPSTLAPRLVRTAQSRNFPSMLPCMDWIFAPKPPAQGMPAAYCIDANFPPPLWPANSSYPLDPRPIPLYAKPQPGAQPATRVIDVCADPPAPPRIVPPPQTPPPATSAELVPFRHQHECVRPLSRVLASRQRVHRRAAAAATRQSLGS